MENLNRLETEILKRLSDKYPSVNNHIPFVKVKNRQVTGVGMYVNFEYQNDNTLEKLPLPDNAISSNDIIKMEGLENGLNWEVDITNGRLQFIEIVSNGESWDGIIRAYSFIPFNS